MDGSRTHHGPQRGPPPVLKTGEPTGTQPLPRISILQAQLFVNEGGFTIATGCQSSRSTRPPGRDSPIPAAGCGGNPPPASDTSPLAAFSMVTGTKSAPPI